MIMSIIKLKNGLELYYKVCGKGKPLILIAGLGCDHEHWNHLVPYLTKSYQLILVDNRGVGRSSYPDVGFSIKDMADDVIQLIDSFGLKQVSILGHSMGGAITQVLAWKYPQQLDRVIISNSFVQSNSTLDYWGNTILKMKAELKFSRYEQTLLSLMMVYSGNFLRIPENISRLAQAIANDPYYQQDKGFEHQFQAIQKFNSLSWLDNISIPVLVIGGFGDKVTPLADSQIMYQSIPQAQLEVLSDAHVPMHENPSGYAQLIMEFLR